MKANELSYKDLMIGDWVLFDHNPVRVAILGAAQDSLGLAVGDNVVGQAYSMIEHIPLTKEILEKNGFTRYGTDYILKGEHFGLDNPSNPNNYLDNYWLRISIKAIHIEYVHELQHALRICGIEKDIEL